MQSVQSSLFARLRRLYPAQRSAVAWALVRLGQGDHPQTSAARAEFGALRGPRLAEIATIVSAVRSRSSETAYVELCAAIEREIAIMMASADIPDANHHETRMRELLASGIEWQAAHDQVVAELGPMPGAT